MAAAFYMPLTGANNLVGRGVVVSGTISTGSVKKGDILLLSTGAKCCVKEVFFENKLRPGAVAGETVLLLIKGEGCKLNARDIPQGTVLSSDGVVYAQAIPSNESADDEIIYDID